MTVTPSTGLVGGEPVRVTVTGFGSGGKYWVSECLDAADANAGGCSAQLPAQTFGVTDATGNGSLSFTVTAAAGTTAYDPSSIRPCTGRCVLVATAGIGGGFATAPLHFTADRVPPGT